MYDIWLVTIKTNYFYTQGSLDILFHIFKIKKNHLGPTYYFLVYFLYIKDCDFYKEWLIGINFMGFIIDKNFTNNRIYLLENIFVMALILS